MANGIERNATLKENLGGFNKDANVTFVTTVNDAGGVQVMLTMADQNKALNYTDKKAYETDFLTKVNIIAPTFPVGEMVDEILEGGDISKVLAGEKKDDSEE